MPLDADVHLVLCSFGRAGLAYIEADPGDRTLRLSFAIFCTDNTGIRYEWSQ